MSPTPPRPKSKSSDDLEKLDALDAAESRATAALRLMNDERLAREEAEAELERYKAAEVQRQLDAVVKAASAPRVELADDTPKPSVRPGMLMVQAKGLRVGIPLAILVPVLAACWAAVQQYLELRRQVAALVTISTTKDTRLDEQDKRITDQAAKIAELRETQAQLSGFLTGVLPKAGVNVPGTGSPIISDPLPLGARRQTPITVRTPVPTPPPK